VKDSAHQRPSLVKDSAGSRNVHPQLRIVLRDGSCPRASPFLTSSTQDPDNDFDDVNRECYSLSPQVEVFIRRKKDEHKHVAFTIHGVYD
jgi:hypothetical protein